MAAIQERIGKDGKKSFRVLVRRKGQPLQTMTFTSKTLAKQWATKVEAEIQLGKVFKASPSKQKYKDTINTRKRYYFSGVNIDSSFKKILQDISESRDAKPVFNLRRFSAETGEIVDSVFLIIPRIKLEICDHFSGINTVTHVEIADDNHILVNDSAPLEGCVVNSSGETYLFLRLINRYKESRGGTWLKRL